MAYDDQGTLGLQGEHSGKPSDEAGLSARLVYVEDEAEPIGSQEKLATRMRGLLKRDRSVQIALGFAVVLLLTAAFGPLLLSDTAQSANVANRFLPPLSMAEGWEYVLGSDAVGRSFLARLVVASRTTLTIAILAVLSAAIVGFLVGTVVGYLGGIADAVAMRAADVMLAFPTLLLALVVLYTFPKGIGTLIFVLAVTRLAVYTRVARGETLAVRERLYVRAARALGATRSRIILRQVAPVIAPTVGVLATLEFALVILAESSLSFLGIGIQPPDVTWGMLISEGRNYLRDAWWVALLPGVAITATTISVNILADWFRRAGEPS